MSTEELFGESEGQEVAEPSIMVPPSIERILPINSDFLQTNARFVCENTKSAYSLALEGSSNAHRVGLLFQAAVSYTIEGAHVVYVCPAPFTRLPPGVHGMNQPNPASAQRLKLMYLPLTAGLVDFLASIHRQPTWPEVLIIDDLHTYISQTEDAGLEHSAARLFAHLVDALHFMESKSEDKAVHLILGMDTLSAGVSEILPQFFQAVYSLKESSTRDEFRMVPVCGSRSQVEALVRRSSPLAGFIYNYNSDTIRLAHVYQEETPT